MREDEKYTLNCLSKTYAGRKLMPKSVRFRPAYHSADAIKKFPELWPLANVGKLGLTREDLRNGLEPS